MKNAHPNAPRTHRIQPHFRRPTHKQSIAIQTATDPSRYTGQLWRSRSRNIAILQTMLK